MALKDKFQKTLNQGVAASRELFSKAKDKAKDLGDMGVLKFELNQLAKQKETLFTNLGSEVFDVLFSEGQNTVSKKTPAIKKYLDDLEDLTERIKAKEEILKNHEKSKIE